MEIRIWNYLNDDYLIPSFLESMALSHKQKKKSIEWFKWKFEESPYGKAVLSCAIENQKIVGCVAYGMGFILFNGTTYSCALSYETFVHPEYQGKGIFKKLILEGEKELQAKSISFLYNFPNASSLPGFRKMNWKLNNNILTYRIKLISILKVLLNFKSLKSSFISNASNIKECLTIDISSFSMNNPVDDIIRPLWTKEYLKWRFLTHPNREYYIINNNDFFSISMIGFRGKLKEARILFVNVSKKENNQKSIVGEIVNELKKSIKPDFIGYSSTIFDNSFTKNQGFFRVPSRSNFCYKVLDSNLVFDELKIVLPAINAHTF